MLTIIELIVDYFRNLIGLESKERYYSIVTRQSFPYKGSMKVSHTYKFTTKTDVLELLDIISKELKQENLKQDLLILNILTFKNK